MANELRVRVGLDSAAFFAGLSRVQGAVAGAAGNITRIASRVSAALAAIGAPLTAGAFAAGIKNALDFGGNLSDLSARTGVAVDQLVILQQAFKDSGLGAEQVGAAVNKMQRSLVEAKDGAKGPAEALAKLGLSAGQLLKQTPVKQLEAISQAIARIPNPAERAAVAMELFGRSGAELNALFMNPAAMRDAAKIIGSQADLLAKNADRFDRVSDILSGIGAKIRGFFVGVADSLLPQLEKLANFIASIDLAGIGQRFGKVLASGINILTNAFKEGKIGELVGLSLKVAFGEAVNFLVGGLRTALLGLASVVVNLFSKDTISVLVNGLVGAAEKFGAAVISVFGDAIAFVSAGLSVAIQKTLGALPEFVKTALGIGGFKAQSFSEAFAEQKSVYQPEFVKKLNELADKDLGEAGAAAGRLLGKIIEDLKAVGQDFKPAEVFNTAEWRDAIVKLAKELNIAPEAIEDAAKKTAIAADTVQETASTGIKAPDMDVDEYARRGLFVSAGAASASANFMRSIADATRRTAQALTGTVKVEVTGGASFVVAQS